MPDKSKTKIIVFGILFWYPLAGVTYQFLHFMLGLRKLGFDPYYIEDSARWIYNPDLRDSSPDAAPNIKAVAPILEMHGLADRWAFRGHYEGGKCYGMNETQIAELYRTADVMINVTGAQELREEHLHCPVRVYLETDPVVSQIQIAQGRQDTIAALDMFTHHLARAFLKDARIIVLDEPTTGLDAQTEADLLITLKRLMAGRTTIIIAHHLHTVRHVDQIIVLQGGELMQTGSHEQLLQLGGLYRHLYELQAQPHRQGAEVS